jgi:hypothetical protein
MKYLYKTPEDERIDLSMKFQPLTFSPLAQVLHYLGVHFPDCWIGVRISSDFLKRYLPSILPYKNPDEYKIPGDFDIIGGTLTNKIPTDYIVGVEIKRFRYTASGDLKNPDEFGRRKTIGYTLFGFNKVMLCHFVVAETVHHPDYHDWLLNAGIVSDGMLAVKKKNIGIKQDTPCGYCILGWSQVSHKDPLQAGGMPEPDINKRAQNNPLANDINFQQVRVALIERVRQVVGQKMEAQKNQLSQPIIIYSKDFEN